MKIPTVDQCRYLGITISTNNSDVDLKRQMRKLYANVKLLLRKFSKCSVDVKCFLFKTYCSNLYSAPMWFGCTNAALKKLKIAYNNSLRRFMFLPRRNSATEMFVNLGIHSFDEMLKNVVFIFRSRVTASHNKLISLFFSICINDIVNSTSKFNFLMYADDTTLYFNIEDFPLQSREADINNELKKVNTWLQLNKLSLNTDKSKFMLFHKKRTPPEINISINNSDIERVSQFTFLGIVLDETLSWKNHITMITNKLSRINGVLHRLKFIFPKNILLTIYKSLFMPHINYGSLVWGNNFEAISKLQKRAIRTITHSHYIAHSEPLLKQLNLLKVKDMIDLKLLKFLHKLNASKLPQYFNSYKPYLEKNETKYNLRPNPLVMPAVNHVYAENLLIYRLVKLKNMFSLHYPLVDDKLNDGTHSLVGFGRYIAKVIIDKYSYQCSNNPCLPCGRL